MRALLLIVVVTAVVWLGWDRPLREYIERTGPAAVQEDHSIPTVEETQIPSQAAAARRVDPSPVVAPADAPHNQPRPQLNQVTCYVCTGEGFIMVRKGTVRVSGTETREPCPACFAQGYRKLVLPRGYELCPDCQGMGKKVWTETRTDSVIKVGQPCPRCATRGYVRAGATALR